MPITNITMNGADCQRLKDLIERSPHEHRDYYRDLRRKLEAAHCRDAAEIPSDVVTMGSTFRLREVESRDSWTFTLCYPEDVDIDRNCISILSPVGTAIIGQRVGEIVEWPVPDGLARIQIGGLVYQPEAAELDDLPEYVSR